MNGIDIQKEIMQELKEIQNKINSDVGDSINSYLLSYAVIKITGSIEAEFKKCIFEKVTEGSNEIIKDYFTRKIINNSSNPKTGRIESILGEFNSEWSRVFSNKTKEIIDAVNLNSLVTLRNSFAHGSAINTSIEDLIKYSESGFKIIDILRESVR